MYIQSIDVAKYRHLKNITLGPFSRPADASDLVVLAGPNGGGKSSVLELLSLALSNMWSLTYGLNRTSPESSFEVTIGLLPKEIEHIESRRAANPNPAAAFEYLHKHHSYCRSFNFKGGEYEKEPALHNQMHELVTEVLRGSWSKPLGFHLSSERSYQKAAFQRENLFKYKQYSASAHVWSFAFQNTAAQYRDMFDFLVTWRWHFTRRLGAYHLRKQAGALAPDEGEPLDEYDRILQRVFPGYCFVDKDEDAPTDLYVQLPSREIVSFSDLSSGEKEVFFTLCFFERHSVQEAVLLIDEPELHLHPSLGRLLLRTMQDLKPRNQIWLATQSSEVIDEAGRDRVWFIQKDTATQQAKLTAATDEEASLECLRDLFGYSGYIGLAKAMIFTEGRNASADRKMFSRLIPQSSREIKFIPANGCSEVERINRAVLAILESDVGWCRFGLIRDRDYMTDGMVAGMKARSGDKLHILSRHEIENYLLDPEVISKVLREIYDKDLAPGSVTDHLRDCARSLAGDVLRDMVAFRLNYIFRPEDFSVAKLLRGELGYSATTGWDAMKLSTLQAALSQKCGTAVADLNGRIQTNKCDDLFDACRTEVQDALTGDAWLTLFPGKELLKEFCSDLSLGKPPILQNSIIKEMAAQQARAPQELVTFVQSLLA